MGSQLPEQIPLVNQHRVVDYQVGKYEWIPASCSYWLVLGAFDSKLLSKAKDYTEIAAS